MKKSKIENCRNKDGYINLNVLDNYREKGEIVEGSNAKTWFNVEGCRFLFKQYDSALPAFGEVLYSKIGNNAGVNCAVYDFALYNGKIGTISYDFLKENEVYYNCLELTTQFSDTKFSYEEIRNNRDLLILHNNKYNNLSSIQNLLNDLFNVSDVYKKKMEIELIKMFCLDTVFWHRDRNLWNYGIIINEETDSMKFSPCHDNSYVLCLEKGKEYIEEVIAKLICGGKIDNPDENTSSFNIIFGEDNSIEQLAKFYEVSDKKQLIEDLIKNIEVDSVVEEVNKVCKIDDVSILWVKAILNYRKNMVLREFENLKSVKDVALKPNVNFSKRK